MILVIGATGQSGAAALRALLADRASVRALARRPVDLPCEIVRGDLLEPETLAPALDGVTAIVNCLGLGHSLRTRPSDVELAGNRNLIAAAPPGAHIVYLSALMAGRAPYAKPLAD